MSAAATTLESPQEALARGRRAVHDGDLRSALEIAADLVRLHPQRAEGHCLHGIVARERGDGERAEAELARSLELEPKNALAHIEFARLRLNARRSDQALDHASNALYLEPDSPDAFHEMGRAYEMRDELEEAVACLKRALELDPERIDSYSALGWVCLRQKKVTEAMQMYEAVLERDPDNLDAQHQLGYAYVRSEQYARGLALFQRVCERAPPSVILTRVNLGNAYFHTGQFEAALRLYDQILAQEQNQFETRWNRAHLLLAEHRFDEGWRDYEYRVFLSTLWTPRLFPFRPWKGEPLEGKALLVISEQGLGDEIMFGSCIPDVLQRSGRVVIECNERLSALFRRSFPKAQVFGRKKGDLGAPWLKGLGRIDYQVYMGTLPRLLRSRWADFPEHRGFLRADPERVAYWRGRLAALGPGPKVGLSWRGGTLDTRRSMRSLELDQLRPVLGVPRVRFVSLQYGADCGAEVAAFAARSAIALAHWQDAIDDYDETAALCQALDLTVSVCTSIIHLNGALGRPAWVLVPAVPEWRYGVRGERMPWYPSVRLLRARQIDVWNPVIERMAADLRSFATGAATGAE